jgi:hypothetical protein
MVAMWPIVHGLLAVFFIKMGWSSDGAILFVQFCNGLVFLLIGMKLLSWRSRRVKAEVLAVGPPPVPVKSEESKEPTKPKSTEERLQEGLRARMAQAESERLIPKAIYLYEIYESSHPAQGLRIEVKRGDPIRVSIFHETDGQELEVFKGKRYQGKRETGRSFVGDSIVYDKTIDEHRTVENVFHKIPDRIEPASEEIELFKPGPWQSALGELYAKARVQREAREAAATAAQLTAAAAREAGLQSSKDESQRAKERYAKEIRNFDLSEFLQDEEDPGKTKTPGLPPPLPSSTKSPKREK